MTKMTILFTKLERKCTQCTLCVFIADCDFHDFFYKQNCYALKGGTIQICRENSRIILLLFE